MPTDETNDAVIGDGVLTFEPQNQCEEQMTTPIDLPPSVSAQFMANLMGNLDANSQRARDAATQANNVLMGAMARNFDQLDAVESRATSGVMATPIASPAVQTGP